ncbi:MAG TPA: undecaprenyldiphospho-muramoylpentapeptide beta-N-acetylglucosaminyltransferase [Terriglobales bacterium]|nr:undecaprenyldiphospho-muramoylpentapeptide beta-N-acetylglucosaminyltransferase [Terriglobales bacterium]
MMKVVIAGGGTGGHVIPAIAIGRELKQRYGAELLFIGTARGIETRLVPQSGFELKLVKVGALKNVTLMTRAQTVLDLPLAVLSARRFLKEFGADVMVGVGGYASGPAMMAALLSGIPTLAFEPNVVPGFANRAVGKRVSAAAVHFEESKKYFRNATLTGVPVREEFFTTQATPASKTLLITGGSQGARAINRAVMESLPELAKIEGLHVIHQTGERDYNDVSAAYQKAGVAANVSPFIQDMPNAFAHASLLLCRSGASTVAEIAAAGKPAIFVPFPYAADDHQLRNAEALAEKGAAVVVKEKDLTPASLSAAVAELINDPPRLEKMSQRAREQAHPGAGKQIAEMVAALAKSR